MDNTNFSSDLYAAVAVIDGPEFAAVPNQLKAQAATSSLIQSILSIFKLLGAQAVQHIPEIKAAALAVYDTRIAPINILPTQFAALEPIIDMGGRVLIVNVIDALAAALVTVTPTPPVTA